MKTVNVQSLSDKAKNYARKNNCTPQQAMQYFAFERFLERLSVSEYKNNFILKGGLLLSSIMGINLRTTMDIDANITGMDFSRDEIIRMLSEIIAIDLNDNVSFELDAIEPIKEDNEYGGFAARLTTKFFNVRIPLHIDISTGDIITPAAINFEYKIIFDEKTISLLSYNYETIIAEKLQTVLKRNVLNSRMKDLYDLYFFMKFKKNDLNKDVLKRAIKKTFEHRESIKELNDMTEILERIRADKTQQKFWENYRNRFSYAEDVCLDEIIDEIETINSMLV